MAQQRSAMERERDLQADPMLRPGKMKWGWPVAIGVIAALLVMLVVALTGGNTNPPGARPNTPITTGPTNPPPAGARTTGTVPPTAPSGTTTQQQ